MRPSTHDLLQTERGLNLPEQVADALIDRGTAGNAAATAVAHAQWLEHSARSTAEAAAAAQRPVWHRSTSALAESARTYSEILIVEYAIVTADYATYAARVVTDVIARQTPAAPRTVPIRPSQVLGDLPRLLPLIQVPDARTSPPLPAETNEHLAAVHEELTAIVKVAASPRATLDYDDLKMAARRPPGAVELVVDFPAALHAYASALTWTIGLITAG